MVHDLKFRVLVWASNYLSVTLWLWTIAHFMNARRLNTMGVQTNEALLRKSAVRSRLYRSI